ncbi:MAG: hypothetical protein KC731_32080 [Myxococcales bacterium]|nr:hypothetical protein [Myxococcales bacterium]
MLSPDAEPLPGRRCERHDLALGPDGQCVLCRRDAAPPTSRGRVVGLAVLLVVVLGGAGAYFAWSEGWLRGADATAEGLPQTRVQWKERHPLDAPGPMRERAGLDEAEDYDLAAESFQVFVPEGGGAGGARGLLVWISPGSSGEVPDDDWGKVLGKHRLLWVGANRSGNERAVNTRVGLALTAVENMKRDHEIDGERIWVGGFSGGAKSALRALLGFPDVFRGGVFCGGADYFRPLPAPGGRRWRSGFGRPQLLPAARQRSIALVVGTEDFNFTHVSAVHAGMGEDGFDDRRLFTVPGIGHRLPSAETLDEVLTWLDEG